MLSEYPADAYDFTQTTQDKDGPVKPPSGPGWILVCVTAAQDGDAAVTIATWARKKSTGGMSNVS